MIWGYSVDGGKIRQGLVYRGGEFELHMNLTAKGVEDLLRLKIRTEIDLRGESIGKVDFTTAEVVGVKRILIPAVPYTDVFSEKFSKNVKKFFKVFTVKSNYPLYYHC